METNLPKLKARVCQALDLREADVWSMTFTQDFRYLWRGRDEDEIWIAHGSAFESESLSECLQVLAAIQPLELLPFKPRVFGHAPFDTAREDVFAKRSFEIPSMITKWKADHSESVEIGESFAKRAASNFPAITLPKSVKIETEKNMFSREAWRKAIEKIRNKIKTGELRKAVLGRQIKLEYENDISLADLFQALAKRNLSSYLIGSQKEETYFASASPECLFRVKDGNLHADSLAGTRPLNGNLAQNERQAKELFESAKEREEHAVVKDYLQETLSPFCTSVTAESEPRVKQFSTIQHLVTDVYGELRNPVDIESILDALHPTPAVCGTPRETAKNLIRELELRARGLFTGAIGWATADEAEFVVGIRSAIIEGNTATLFAGAGIVAESDADAEYDECSLKMETMRKALPK